MGSRIFPEAGHCSFWSMSPPEQAPPAVASSPYQRQRRPEPPNKRAALDVRRSPVPGKSYGSTGNRAASRVISACARKISSRWWDRQDHVRWSVSVARLLRPTAPTRSTSTANSPSSTPTATGRCGWPRPQQQAAADRTCRPVPVDTTKTTSSSTPTSPWLTPADPAPNTGGFILELPCKPHGGRLSCRTT